MGQLSWGLMRGGVVVAALVVIYGAITQFSGPFPRWAWAAPVLVWCAVIVEVFDFPK